MNPVLLEVVSWFLEKAILEAGKDVCWETIKLQLEEKVDAMIPGVIADKIANYILDALIDVVAGYFKQSLDPQTPEVVHNLVEKARDSLLGKVVADLFELKK